MRVWCSGGQTSITGASNEQGGSAGERRENIGQLTLALAPPIARQREEALMLALRGELQCKLWPRDDTEIQFARDEGLDLDQVLTIRNLVDSDHTFFAATGVSI